MAHHHFQHPQPHVHLSHRAGWIRAALLGANDGIVSIAGLVVGVAASGAGAGTVLLSGVAGTVAGAMSMAAGEYVSVQSQADIEQADLELEKRMLRDHPEDELEELAGIYERRGLEPALAREVACQLTANDALEAHARDEIGITDTLRARPVEAAVASAIAFVAGSLVPLLAAVLAPHEHITPVAAAATVAGLLLSGAAAAHAGGGPRLRAALRAGFWGVLAMAAAGAVGRLFGAAG